MKKPTNDWLSALESAMEQSADKPGKEWLTMADLQEKLGLERKATERAVKMMFKAGSVESRKFTIIITGQRRHIAHYKLL